MMPKIRLLYFKNLLDIAFSKFFDICNDLFSKNDKGQYVLSKDFSCSRLSKFIIECIETEFNKVIPEYNILEPTLYIIIGACTPKDNILLKCNSVDAYPTKLVKLLNAEYPVKYILKEKDIYIDIVRFNDACNKAFQHFFKKMNNKSRKNVLFIQHNRLDCYALFKILKLIFGNANCINMQQELYADIRQPIYAVNDVLDRYSTKKALNKDAEFKNIIEEIREYIKETTYYGN